MVSKIDELDTTGARERIHNFPINVKMPKEIVEILDQLGEGQGGRSVIVRRAVKEYLVKRGY